MIIFARLSDEGDISSFASKRGEQKKLKRIGRYDYSFRRSDFRINSIFLSEWRSVSGKDCSSYDAPNGDVLSVKVISYIKIYLTPTGGNSTLFQQRGRTHTNTCLKTIRGTSKKKLFLLRIMYVCIFYQVKREERGDVEPV